MMKDDMFDGAFGGFENFEGDKIDDRVFNEKFAEFHGETLEDDVEPRSLGEVLVIGAKHPGIDSLACAIAMADLKNTVDIKRKYTACISGELDPAAQFCVEEFGIDLPRKTENVNSDDSVILVAHNSAADTVDGAEEANVMELVDIHPLDSLKTQSPLYVRCEPRSATATIIYEMYKEDEEGIEKKIAALLCAAIIYETDMFKKESMTQLDKVAALELANIGGIDLMDFSDRMPR